MLGFSMGGSVSVSLARRDRDHVGLSASHRGFPSSSTSRRSTGSGSRSSTGRSTARCRGFRASPRRARAGRTSARWRAGSTRRTRSSGERCMAWQCARRSARRSRCRVPARGSSTSRPRWSAFGIAGDGPGPTRIQHRRGDPPSDPDGGLSRRDHGARPHPGERAVHPRGQPRVGHGRLLSRHRIDQAGPVHGEVGALPLAGREAGPASQQERFPSTAARTPGGRSPRGSRCSSRAPSSACSPKGRHFPIRSAATSAERLVLRWPPARRSSRSR